MQLLYVSDLVIDALFHLSSILHNILHEEVLFHILDRWGLGSASNLK